MAEINAPNLKIRTPRNPYRPDRLAVASETGQNIDACFGKAELFRIYELKSDVKNPFYELLELRPAFKPCREQSHDQTVLGESAELLKDCGLVLAGRLGPGALKALSDRGIIGLAVHWPVDEALERLAKR
ncbi:MAG: hypothetical protein LBP22_15560 [Deltaproteobacteria bacterium]|jgi:predicted Fe-Mo cluster-binding NifX family protein|nr:hypothetical protein [Deltaproteobacteria bacterium]